MPTPYQTVIGASVLQPAPVCNFLHIEACRCNQRMSLRCPGDQFYAQSLEHNPKHPDTLLRLVGPLHNFLSGIFTRERLNRTRRVTMVHWALFLLLHAGLFGEVVRVLCLAGDIQRLKNFLYLQSLGKNSRILLGGSVGGLLQLRVRGDPFREEVLIRHDPEGKISKLSAGQTYYCIHLILNQDLMQVWKFEFSAKAKNRRILMHYQKHGPYGTQGR